MLLHLLVQARSQLPAQLVLRALHVDHGLQAAAADFRRFCRRTARSWRVPLQAVKAHVQLARGDSVEEAARNARYTALASALRPGELLLTAQHADDQLETLLLALLRGAGPAGLAAMPAAAPFASTLMLRPLLTMDRAQLAAHAARHALAWADDPSNAQLRFDRNYLRARVLPLLRERWPQAAKSAGRSAGHSAVAAAALEESAREDLELAADGPDVEIAVLNRWSQARRMAVLRLWIAQRGFQMPELRHMQQILALMEARIDAQPELVLPQYAVRRHAGRLMLDTQPHARSAPDATRVHRWSWRRGALQLADGSLEIVADLHGDLDLHSLPSTLLVQHPGASGGRSLRKLMQELDVPDWQRGRLPLIRAGTKTPGALLAVADLWLAEGLRSSAATVSRGRIFWRDLR